MAAKIGGKNFDVNLGDLLVHVESGTLDITVMRVQGGPPPGGHSAGGAPSGGGMRMQSGGGRNRGGGMMPGQGRFNVSLYHTYRIQDEITIRDGDRAAPALSAWCSRGAAATLCRTFGKSEFIRVP